MRGMDVILGGLLLSTGLVAPGLLTTEDVLDPSRVAGSATFDAARVSGSGEVQASEAALEALGPVTATIHAEQVVVTVIERTRAEAVVETDDLRTNPWVAPSKESTHSFANATIRIEGFDDGELQAWPDGGLGGGTFALGLAPRADTVIKGTGPGVVFEKDDDHRHELEGPLFALGHGTDRRHVTPASPASFDRLDMQGAITLVLDNGTATIAHDGDNEDGKKEYRAEDAWAQSDPSDGVRAREETLVVLSLRQANGTVAFDEGVQSTFFAREPAWTVNGTLSFEAQEGRLSAGEVTNRSLRDAPVEIEGRTVLSPVAKPVENNGIEDAFAQVQDDLRFNNPPRVASTFEAEADNVTVAGEPLDTVSSSPAIPEEVTFWGKVLGLLMLVVSVGKKLFGFVAPLLVRDPLDNDRRQRIFSFLQDVGMAHVREIHRATGYQMPSLRYHLRVLRSHDLVARVEQNGYTVFFPLSEDLCAEEREKLALLADSSRRSIAETLVQAGEATQDELIEAVGLSQPQVSRHVSRLVDGSLVEQGDGWPRGYRPTELLQRWVRRLGGGE